MAGPHVLLTGATGYLGHHLLAELRRRGVRCTTAGRRDADVAVDLADPAAIRRALAAAGPDVVLNCAALSRLGACEERPELARRINTEAPVLLSESPARLLQVSTDLVFDGAHAPYTAGAAARPLSVYGRTKADAEAIVAAAGGLVARLPLLFGRSFDGRRGATDMIRGSATVALYTNEFRTPLHVADAARGLVDLLLEERAGIAHLAGLERVSRHQLGLRFAAAANLSPSRVQPAECTDPLRPRDVSMITDWPGARALDDALRDC